MLKTAINILGVVMALLGLATVYTFDQAPPRWQNAAAHRLWFQLAIAGFLGVGLLALTMLILAIVAMWRQRTAPPAERFAIRARIFLTVGVAMLVTAMEPTVVSIRRPSDETMGMLTTSALFFLGFPGLILTALAGVNFLYHRRNRVSPRGFDVVPRG